MVSAGVVTSSALSVRPRVGPAIHHEPAGGSSSPCETLASTLVGAPPPRCARTPRQSACSFGIKRPFVPNEAGSRPRC